MQHHIFNTMRGLKMIDGCKGTQVYSLNQGNGGVAEKFLQHLQDNLRVNSMRSKSHRRNQSLPQMPNNTNVNSVAEAFSVYGLPQKDLAEPQIDPFLKFVDYVDVLADAYRRFDECPEFDRSRLYIEQSTIFRGFHDAKLFRRCLRSARQYAVDVHLKIVLSSWLRYERREDELFGVSSLTCNGLNMECPKASLLPGYNPESANDLCCCSQELADSDVGTKHCSRSISFDDDVDDYDLCFCIGDSEVRCNRFKFASLSRPFKALLYGSFMESRSERIYFSENGISARAMAAAVVFTRTKNVNSFDPNTVLELLTLANRFCCDEMKSSCDAYLASLVTDMDMAVQLIEYGLEEASYLLVAACLQVFLRELPYSLRNPFVMRILYSSEAKAKLELAGQTSFLLYYFLSQIAMEEDMESTTTVMLLERMAECASEKWEKQLAFHQLGCVMLERKEYKDAQTWFEAAVQEGHIYSLVGVARATDKRGQKYKAYKLMNSIISDYSPCGWMYQERSLYNNDGIDKIMDLDMATELNPTLLYPYKYRAIAKMEEDDIDGAIAEINRIIGFKVSADSLELRSWFLILKGDYQGALTDARALFTLDPHYMMFHGKLHGEKLVELLNLHVQEQHSQADCWMQLYDTWSSVDDIGSLAVVHHMLANDPGRSLLRFRQSLLLLRLNCDKAAMRCMRMARNDASSEHERLVYEGWMLYDTGYREQAISKAEKSISVQRSFEAFFLKAYVLSETTTDHESSLYVIHLLEEALRCPSDGLRKGQALSNLASIYVDVDKLDKAVDCYMNALNIKHTRAHQGLARVYHQKNLRKAAYDEMTKLIEKAQFSNNASALASAYEKRSEYSDHEIAKSDLAIATRLDPLRTYPYRYRAAVLMDNHKEAEAITELTKAIAFKPDLQLLHLRAAFHDSMGETAAAQHDCEAALCLDPTHADTFQLYKKAKMETLS